MIIAFEGIDGSGKTSAVGATADWLRRSGHEPAVLRWTSFLSFQCRCHEIYERVLPTTGLVRIDASRPMDEVHASILREVRGSVALPEVVS